MAKASGDDLAQRVIVEGNDLLLQAMSVFDMQQAIPTVPMAFPNVIGVNTSQEPEHYAMDVNQLFTQQERLFKVEPDYAEEAVNSAAHQETVQCEDSSELQAVRAMYAQN